MKQKNCQFMATTVVHGSRSALGADGASFIPVSGPVHHSVAYGYKSMQELDEVFAGSKEGYCYSRFGNPTVHQFERAMAAVEGGEACVAFSSGMAAIHAAFALCNPVSLSAVLASRDLYGPTYLSLRDFCHERGAALEFVDINDLDFVARRLSALSPQFLMIETISNPLVNDWNTNVR